MNCQSFESAVNDLARGQMMDAAARNRALAHALACVPCAARLADEEALTAGLRKMGESRDEAPAHVEASLREAFREMVGAPGQPAVARIDSGSRRWWPWAAAAAILIVALLALSAARLGNGDSQDLQEEASVEKTAQPTVAPGIVEQKPEPPNQIARVNDGVKRGVHQGPRTGGRRSSSKKQTKPVEAAESRTEVATEFIPLIHGEEMSPSDGGQIIRVEMPRSALVAFGLPMNMERAGERVKADVVVGNDGLARAIRFVH